MSTAPSEAAHVLALFRKHVPEFEQGLIEVVNCARRPGSRTYLALRSPGDAVDPLQVCIGPDGRSLLTKISKELGEHIILVRWVPSAADFIRNALVNLGEPQVTLDPHQHTATVAVRRPANLTEYDFEAADIPAEVELISELTGWKINLTEPA